MPPLPSLICGCNRIVLLKMVVLQNEWLQLFDACGQTTFEKGSVLKILVHLFVVVFLSIFGKSASLVVIFGCSGI